MPAASPTGRKVASKRTATGPASGSHRTATVGISDALDREGYAVIESAVKPSDLETIRAAVQPLFARTPLGRNAFEGRRTRRIYSLLAKTRSTDSLASGEFLHALARGVLGHHQISAHVAVQVDPGSAAQELHTDDQVYPVARPHDEFVLSALWALDGLDSDAGTTVVIPGSHRWEDRTLNAADRAGAIAVPVPAGALLLYRGSLWHGVGRNESTDAVSFIHSEFIASWLRPLETHLLSIPRSTVRHLPSRLQELIGYNIRPPYTGSVNGLHPRRSLRRFFG
jgi:ectoine hydroxylase-related dioxygenase (phytanoyl-CoA dioxygenase family)